MPRVRPVGGTWPPRTSRSRAFATRVAPRRPPPGRRSSRTGGTLRLTARTHVSRATDKPGARDRAQLLAAAYASGPTRPGRLG
ncbi:hypothetical protein GCM10022227_23580 [Streptomyces sedi]